MKKITFIIVLISLSLKVSIAQTQSLTLFSSHGPEKNKQEVSELWFYDNPEAVQRFTEVSLNTVITDNSRQLLKGENILLNIFEDTSFSAYIDKTNININGAFAARARIKGQHFAYMLMSTFDNRSLGIINVPSSNTQYKLISCPETNRHFVLELNMNELNELPEIDHLTPPNPTPDVIKEQQRIQHEIQTRGLGPDDHANIDVMIVYTHAAKTWANNSGGGIENVVNISMEQASLSLENSETIMSMRLVHATEVSYAESGSSSNDLVNLTNGEGQLEVVHEWRDEYGADLTAMFTDVNDTGGIAWLLTTSLGNPNIAFSITRVQQAAGLTHTHEMGHNMGCHHHKAQNFQPGPGLFNYSAGWRWVGSDSNYYCDLMTYSNGSFFPDGQTHANVPHFSNPAVTHMSAQTGDYAEGDNARTLKEIKHVIAAYRAAIVNSVEGVVTNEEEEPLADVLVRVSGSTINTYSGIDGTFVFPALSAGDYTLIASLEGYSTDYKDITVDDHETTEVNFVLSLLSMVEVSGTVYGADDTDTGLANVVVSLSGDNYFETKTDEEGNFFFPEVYGASSYSFEVFKPGYDFYINEINVLSESIVIDDITLDEALYPVSDLSAALFDEGTLVSWDEPSGRIIFRYDNGVPAYNAGFFGGTTEGVLGSAHNHRGYIEAVSWMLNGVHSHDFVNVWIMGMNELGLPNPNNIIYHAENVPNTNEEWASYVLSEPVYAGQGFFLGLSTAGNLGLALDNGTTDSFEFETGRHFYNSDISNPDFDFRDMETWISGNFLFRALAFDLGEYDALKSNSISNKPSSHPIEVGDHFNTVLKSENFPASIQGYRIYLNDMTSHIDEVGVDVTDYLFEDLSSGTFTVGIQTVYDIGLSEITTVTFPPYVGLDEVIENQISIYPNPVRDVLFVESNSNINEIRIYNITGKLIYTEKTGALKTSIETGNFIPGFYFINISNETGTQTHKVVIQK